MKTTFSFVRSESSAARVQAIIEIVRRSIQRSANTPGSCSSTPDGYKIVPRSIYGGQQCEGIAGRDLD